MLLTKLYMRVQISKVAVNMKKIQQKLIDHELQNMFGKTFTQVYTICIHIWGKQASKLIKQNIEFGIKYWKNGT